MKPFTVWSKKQNNMKTKIDNFHKILMKTFSFKLNKAMSCLMTSSRNHICSPSNQLRGNEYIFTRKSLEEKQNRNEMGGKNKNQRCKSTSGKSRCKSTCFFFLKGTR